jgi:hypothetical protein
VKVVNIENAIARPRALSILRKLPLFKNIEVHDLKALLEYCAIHKVDADHILFEQDDNAHSLFIVLNGVIEIAIAKIGVINIMQQGEVLGELGIITSMPRFGNARALLDDTLLLEIKKSDLDFLVGGHPHLSYSIMRNLANALAERYATVSRENISDHSPNMPWAQNISVGWNRLSEPIAIRHDPAKMELITHYYISRVEHGKLFLEDGETEIAPGESIAVDAIGEGFRFKLTSRQRKGWFDIQLSNEGNPKMRESEKCRVTVFGYAIP